MFSERAQCYVREQLEKENTMAQVETKNTLRVLVVDDSVLVRARLVLMLSELEGVEVVSLAKDAGEAVEKTGQLRPDIVLLDFRMPGGSGLTVLQAIKLLSPAPVVIMLTNYTSLQVQIKCRNAGADYFFDKSAEFEEVVNVLHEMRGLKK